MTRPLLSLVMIVKDEAQSIAKVLESVKPFIDHWEIVDTGSTDGTRQAVLDSLQGIPGNLHSRPFIDFATNRNDVLAFGLERAEFALMLSGDEYLREGTLLRAYLEKELVAPDVGCHFIRVNIDQTTFMSPRIFRTGGGWRYEGVVHEVPFNRVNPNAPVGFVPDVVIEHIVSDPEKRFSNIWEIHIPLLEKELARNPNDERSLIYLAQSYEALFFGMEPEERKEYAKEAVKLYLRRLAIPTGTEVERNFCRMHCIDTMRLTEIFTPEALLLQAEELAKDDPMRPETALLVATLAMPCRPLPRVFELAEHAAAVSEKAAQIDNTSPIDMSCRWRAHHIAAVAAKQLSQKHPEKASRELWAEKSRSHITAGLAAMGPWPVFKAIAADIATE